ncbi:MAG: class I SAM-dependent methyltransferase [Alphaproteobacteria bacterium]|nr:class I SAM-dependent methyltransferase [Alphaproteobacteria bacterium]
MASKRRTYQRIAGLYDLLDVAFEYGRYRPLRRLMFEGLSGKILDAGVGTGRNMAFYPSGANVIGIDLSEAMLARARGRQTRAMGRRGRADIDVELRAASVLDTGFADDEFDAIVATFLFCVLDDADQQPALEELKRICKPGGQIRILEYAWSKSLFRRLIMRAWAPWVKWAYGAAFDRDTEQYVEAAGLEIIESRFVYKDIIKLIVVRPKKA